MKAFLRFVLHLLEGIAVGAILAVGVSLIVICVAGLLVKGPGDAEMFYAGMCSIPLALVVFIGATAGYVHSETSRRPLGWSLLGLLICFGFLVMIGKLLKGA